MSEKRFEDSLKKALKDLWPGSHVKKIASPYVGGILDLYTKVTVFPSMWIELKYHSYKSRPILPPLRGVKLELTDLQRNFIRKEHAAGAPAGWMIAIEWLPSGHSILVSGTDPDCTVIHPDDIIKYGVVGKKYRRSKEELEKLLRGIQNHVGPQWREQDPKPTGWTEG